MQHYKVTTLLDIPQSKHNGRATLQARPALIGLVPVKAKGSKKYVSPGYN